MPAAPGGRRGAGSRGRARCRRPARPRLLRGCTLGPELDTDPEKLRKFLNHPPKVVQELPERVCPSIRSGRGSTSWYPGSGSGSVATCHGAEEARRMRLAALANGRCPRLLGAAVHSSLPPGSAPTSRVGQLPASATGRRAQLAPSGQRRDDPSGSACLTPPATEPAASPCRRPSSGDGRTGRPRCPREQSPPARPAPPARAPAPAWGPRRRGTPGA